MPAINLAVDMIRCDGHGICAWLFPERVSLDRWGYPMVDPGTIEEPDRKRALRAVRACPRQALMISSGATVQR